MKKHSKIPKRSILLSYMLLVVIFGVCTAAAADDHKGDIIKIAAVGDVMMGSEGRMPPYKPEYLFKACKSYLKSADVAFLNHEATMADSGESVKKSIKGKSYAFRTPTSFAAYLSDAGFNMASLANNHTFDYGHPGLKSTVKALSENGMAVSHHSGSIARMNVRGLKVAMAAFWIYSGDPHDLNNIPRAKKITADLASKNDIVIISFHGGAEGAKYIHTPKEMEQYLGEKRGDVVAFSHAVVDSGADLVLGHGPHVPRAMEMYKGRLIAYSLGNFCTLGFSTKSYTGYAPLLLVDLHADGRPAGGRIVSFLQTKPNPLALDPENKAAKLIYKLGVEDFPDSNAVTKDGQIIAQHK